MRHGVAHNHFNRDTKSRKALFKNLVRSLVEHGQITTTIEKAKETKRLADKLIHQAQTDSVPVRRKLHEFFGRRDVVNTLVERVAPALKDRVSGFTRLVVMSARRGDNATVVKLSLVNQPETVGTLKSGKTHTRPAKAKKTVTKKEAQPVAEKKADKPAAKAASKPAAKKAAPAKAKSTKKA